VKRYTKLHKFKVRSQAGAWERVRIPPVSPLFEGGKRVGMHGVRVQYAFPSWSLGTRGRSFA